MPESNEPILISMPKPVLQRMPRYLNYLKARRKQGFERMSSTVIAADLGLNPVQVRKDLAFINDSGKPRTGFDVQALIDDIAQYLGYSHAKNAILVGVGHLGQALLAYVGFAEYGLNILAAFDVDPAIVGANVRGKAVYHTDALYEFIRGENVQIGIITVPAPRAQAVCDRLVSCGIAAIWNFAPVNLTAPDRVIVQNEDIAASLAFLSNELQRRR